MGKKKNDAYYLQILLNQINAANQPSQYENQQTADYEKIRTFLNPGSGAPDYRDPQSKGIFTGMQSLGEYKKQRGQLLGETPDDPLLANQRKLSDDRFDQEYGSAYQDTLNRLSGGQNQLGTSILGNQVFRNDMAVGGYGAALDAIRSKPPGFWGTFLPNLFGGAASMAMGGIGSLFKKKPHGSSAGPGGI